MSSKHIIKTNNAAGVFIAARQLRLNLAFLQQRPHVLILCSHLGMCAVRRCQPLIHLFFFFFAWSGF